MTSNAHALRLAVLEDDDALREDILVPQLADAGFDTEGFASSADLHRRLRETSFDLLVLDLVLDDENGLDIARELRSVSSIGIVMLTGRGSQFDQIRGLHDAVDAWLTKPVDIELLAATLRSLARRMRIDNDGIMPDQAANGWRLAERGWHLYSPDGNCVSLNLLERCLLGRLFATAGEVVTRADLLTLLTTAAENVDSHRLEMLIHRLRRKIHDHLGETLPLRAVRGQGYVMIATSEPGESAR